MLSTKNATHADTAISDARDLPCHRTRIGEVVGAARLFAYALVVGTALGAARGAWLVQATAQATVTVSMEGNRFLPDSLTVAAGTTVIWANNDFASGEQHDVVTNEGSILSDLINPGQIFVMTLSVPGTYRYYCDLHDGMFGLITVN